MSSIKEGIISIISNVAKLLEYLNPFSENFILIKLWDFLTSIVSYLNPFSEDFLGKKIVGLLGDLLNYLFVPSEERINAIINTVSSKFDFVNSIKYAINSIKDIINNIGNAPKLTLNLGATKYTEAQNIVVLDMSWYAPYKIYGDLVLTGFIYLFFVWRLFVHLPNIIQGLGGEVDDSIKFYDTFEMSGFSSKSLKYHSLGKLANYFKGGFGK